MLAASFIDIDEKIIPDEITLPGTLLGLALATALPMSLLPQLMARPAPPLLGVPVAVANNQRVYLEPVTAVAPNPWPPEWGAAGNWQSLVVALACYWLWCFALTPRIWRGRRGAIFALRMIAARVRQAFARRPIRELFWVGTAVIGLLWMLLAQSAWAGLVTALIGLAASGGIVWAVRLIGTAALRREAMGFGDVTLMMMIGTFIGWQAGLVAFFLAPFAGLVIGLAQFALRRDDVIPYGPFLCLGSAVVSVAWAPIWEWAAPLFGQGLLVPAVLILCLALLGIMLAIWQAIKNALFGRGA
jgi:leader peptidase (prepilin peptidase)/N-methyltransferase